MPEWALCPAGSLWPARNWPLQACNFSIYFGCTCSYQGRSPFTGALHRTQPTGAMKSLRGRCLRQNLTNICALGLTSEEALPNCKSGIHKSCHCHWPHKEEHPARFLAIQAHRPSDHSCPAVPRRNQCVRDLLHNTFGGKLINMT